MRHAAFLSALLPLGIAACSSIPISIFAQSLPIESGKSLSVASALKGKMPEQINLLSLEGAIQMALSNNPELSVARREYEAAEGAVIQGSARPNPELAYSQEDVRKSTRSSSLQLNWPIEMGGKRAARLEGAERGRDVALTEFALRQGEVRAAVIAVYFEVLINQERVRLAKETTILAKTAADATAKRVFAGKISPVEESKAQVAEISSKLELSQAESELRNAKQKLSAMWASPVPNFERVEINDMNQLPSLPTEELLEQRITQSPHIKRAEFELRRRQALAKLESAKRTPDPTFSLGVKRSADVGNQLLLGISIPLPVLDGNKGNIVEALRREDKARDELTMVQLRLRSEVLQLRMRLVNQRGESEILSRDVLTSARGIYASALKGFDAGKFSYLEVLDAQRTLIQTQMQHLKALAETYRLTADIDRVIGDLPVQIKN